MDDFDVHENMDDRLIKLSNGPNSDWRCFCVSRMREEQKPQPPNQHPHLVEVEEVEEVI